VDGAFFCGGVEGRLGRWREEGAFRGGRLSGRMVTPVCELDLLPTVRVIDADRRSALDCSTLESPSFDLLGKDQPHRSMGKTLFPHANLKFQSCARGVSGS
jgi:hypothetical protein